MEQIGNSDTSIVMITLLQRLDPLIGLAFTEFGFILVSGSALVGTGVVALNPTYETVKRLYQCYLLQFIISFVLLKQCDNNFGFRWTHYNYFLVYVFL